MLVTNCLFTHNNHVVGIANELCNVKAKKEERRTFFKVGVNKMLARPTHDVMPIGHAISGAGLLTPLGVDTIVIR